MALIVVLSALALAVGLIALRAAATDFKEAATFRRPTAVLIYAAWTTHAAAFVAAVWLDPYRLDALTTITTIIGVVMSVVGIALFVGGLERFRSFGQVTGTEVGELVTGGIYAFTRNPQYTGWILLLSGAGIAGRSPLALMLALAVVVAMRIWTPHEERHLEEEYGENYVQYRRQVPRFVSLNPGRRTKR